MPVPIFVISGPSGCGKTTISQKISDIEQFKVIEGDELHPPANIEKMSNGQPLDDEDRWGWLNDVKDKAVELAQEKGALGVVITCSALKKKYRDILKDANKADNVELFFIFLNVGKDELVRRMETRVGHYMKRSMLESQLHDLELPREDESRTFIVDADKNIDETQNSVLKVVAAQLAIINKQSVEGQH
ncbi:Thermoresistant gluconokinase [Taphrina deformans PYCC 5710]|uniref:Gluconokinase n=1 Tax=Taphrina deformans (strain PYCC 5710 / ATCC 11124 / CBS 356.35 / IMI 108563 / JCM 9778 / NBRC 8474) TaxID=1097556 RepID=R4XD62_TAPDE|nr:Thermoresistant gluconokinase [Taphrina deformans PYCC 5710]|eukprot:CCG83538.1 Thermoresistant gluconokinase [Taphrina deformans PYCC 5710]